LLVWIIDTNIIRKGRIIWWARWKGRFRLSV